MDHICFHINKIALFLLYLLIWYFEDYFVILNPIILLHNNMTKEKLYVMHSYVQHSLLLWPTQKHGECSTRQFHNIWNKMHQKYYPEAKHPTANIATVSSSSYTYFHNSVLI